MRAFALNADIDACGTNPDTLQAKQTNALQNSVHFSQGEHNFLGILFDDMCAGTHFLSVTHF